MKISNCFWVVGGEYVDMSFSRLIEGKRRLIGPFKERAEAYRAWRAVAFATTAQAKVRFSIVEEASLGSAASTA